MNGKTTITKKICGGNTTDGIELFASS